MRAALTLGVLGSAPAATLDFLARVQDYTPTAVASDHIRVILDLNPKIPDLDTPGSGAGPVLAEMAGALRGAGAEVLALASDAAHAHLPLIERASSLPVIDMIGVAAKAAAATGARRVGVLGARGAMRLYREYLAAQALGLVSLAPDAQAEFLSLLTQIRDGEADAETGPALARFIARLAADGAETIILGAVEIPGLLADEPVKVPLIDPADLLAQRCAAVCLGLEPAPSLAG